MACKRSTLISFTLFSNDAVDISYWRSVILARSVQHYLHEQTCSWLWNNLTCCYGSWLEDGWLRQSQRSQPVFGPGFEAGTSDTQRMSTAAACQALRSSSLQLSHRNCQLQGAAHGHCDAVRVGTADETRLFKLQTACRHGVRRRNPHFHTPPRPRQKQDKCRKPQRNNRANSTSSDCWWALAYLWSTIVQWLWQITSACYCLVELIFRTTSFFLKDLLQRKYV